jgi:hypothetical protein
MSTHINIDMTAQVLGSMKGVRMAGLTDKIYNTVQSMRTHVQGVYQEGGQWSNGVVAICCAIVSPHMWGWDLVHED